MIALPKKYRDLLKKCLEKNNPNLNAIVEQNNNFSDDFYNELRNIVCDELILNGFIGDTPNNYGLELENLIDEIGKLFLYD